MGLDAARPPVAARRPRVRRPGALTAGRLAVPIVVLVAWQIGAGTSTLVPGVPETLSTLVSGFTEGWVLPPLTDSLLSVLLGFGLAGMLALPIGIGLGVSRFLGRVFDPVIEGLFAIPRIVFYPALLAIFSVGMSSKVALAVISAFFPIVLITTAAVRDVSATLVKFGRSMNCSALQLVRKIYLPAALPGVMVGLRIGFSVSFISVIIAELFAAAEGLGLEVAHAYGVQDFPRMFALVVLITILAVATNLVLWFVERRVRPEDA